MRLIRKAEEYPLAAAIIGGALISLFPAWFITQVTKIIPLLKPGELQVVSDFFSLGIGPLQLMFFAVVVFIIPPLEELIFRGWIWKLINYKFSPKWTWILVSLLFAGFHAAPLHILGLLPFSFFLGWLRLKTGDINASVLAHMVNNAVGCLLMIL